MGRPTKLTAALQKAICADLELGHYFKQACEKNGLNHDTGEEWLARGRGADNRPAIEPYLSFAARVERATVTGEGAALKTVQEQIRGGKPFRKFRYELSKVKEGGKTVHKLVCTERTVEEARPDGRLALEFLSRRYPERYGRQRMVLEGDKDKPIPLIVLPEIQQPTEPPQEMALPTKK